MNMMAFKLKRADDMPMVGKVTRESKKRNRYVLVLKFKQSRRHYSDEVIIAADKRQALKLARRMYPNAKVK